MKTILGIDPGLRITGFGVIQSNGHQHHYITSGCITTTGTHFAKRLRHIFSELSEVVQQHQPHEAAIEQVFVHENVNSALKLGQARGAAIVAIMKNEIALSEYTARSVKQAVVGYGAADKTQVQHMVKILLNLREHPPADAADALAIALCHAHTSLNSIMRERSD